MGDYKLLDEHERPARRCRSQNWDILRHKFLESAQPQVRRSSSLNRDELDKTTGSPDTGRRGSMVTAAANLFHTASTLEHKINEARRQSIGQRSTTSSRMPESALAHADSRHFELSSEQAVNLRSILNRLVLLPSSPFLLYWDIVVFGGLVVTGLFEPCILVFEQLDGSPSIIVGTTLSMMFMLDTFLHFFRAKKVSTREGVVLVTYLPELCRMYLYSLFMLDFLSSFPFVLLVWVDHDSRSLLIIRITFPMLRFVRLPRLMSHLQEVTHWSFSLINILEFVLMSFLVLHWIACVWALLGKLSGTSWLSVAKQNYVFLTKDRFSDGRVYLVALYWSVTVLTSVGFGDITPQSWSEFVCATVCMSIGGGVWAYVVGSVCGMASAIDKHKNAYESQMNDVSVMSKERNLPKHLQERVRDFYKHAQYFMRMKMYHDTIHELSPALKGEVISWMYGSCFRRVWYFDIVEDDKRCAVVLIEGMVPKMYAPEEFIEDSVDNSRALVFLRSGLAVRKKNLLAPGAVWGLDVILGSEEHQDIEELLDTDLARSINFVFVLKLGKHCIDHAASLHPTFARRLRKAHCRMLLWRGVIAAARAEKRLQEKKENPQTQARVSHWDRLGKLMGQVVHRDRLLLEDQLDPLHPHGKFHDHHIGVSGLNKRRQGRVTVLPNVGISDIAALDLEGDKRQTRIEQRAPADDNKDQLEDWRLPKHRSPPMMHSVSSAPQLPHKRQKPAELAHCSDGHRVSLEIPQLPLARTRELEGDMQKDGFSSDISEESEVADLLSSWRTDVKNSLDAQAAELDDFQAEVQDDIGALGEEVEELARMMHQLLARLDADEKY